VTKNYWWPVVTKDVEKYVDRCNMCQKMKNWTETSAENLIANEVPERLWTHLTVDFITILLLVTKKDVILVVCDRSSKIAYFVTTTEGTLAEGLIKLFRDNVWKLYRLPESVISDREPQFVAELTKKLNRMLGIETKLLISYYL